MDIESRLSRGKEIKEVLPKNEIAFAFIKPDFLDVVPQIEKVLREHSLEIIYTDKVRLDAAAIDYIYSNIKNDRFFPTIKEYLIKNDALVMLISGQGGETQKILSSLKKDKDKDGPVRRMFRKESFLPPEEIELWKQGKHPDQEAVTIRIALGNVIHTADNPKEAVECLKMVVGPKFEAMRKKGNLPAELWELFDEERPQNK